MKWRKLTLTTTTEAVDLVSNMLEEIGIEGIEIVDKIPLSEEDKKAMFIDILPDLEPDDGVATVNFYVDFKEDIKELKSKIQEGLQELSEFIKIGQGTIRVSDTEDKDWINNWKEFFKPFRLDDNIIIKPTWEKLEEVSDEDIVIEIDPGTAFGTGSHETTKLCIKGLKKHITKDTKILDVGCGSGILSIIGLKLGANHAVGIDIDPNAITATYENAEVNGIRSDQFTVFSGNIIEDTSVQDEVGYKKYDIVVANILANVIIPLSNEIGKHMKPNGLFITSGIINTKKEEVLNHILSKGFEVVEINEMGDWVSIIASYQGE